MALGTAPMSLILIHSDRFAEHRPPPGHPERVERAEVMHAVAAAWKQRGRIVQAPQNATREELARVHSNAHLAAIDNTAGRAVSLDPDTYTSPESRDVALLAAGAAIGAVDTIVQDRATRVMALVRPPGHHAERDRAMGFCLYNNVAVAAAEALASGLQRVAIVDIDVHHGNGTQRMFYADPRVLYISSHQFPFYPGTGAANETGQGDGRGYTVNIPLEAGATDGDYDLVYRSVVSPVLEQFAPQLTVISAGFDAHEADPLASMRMTAAGYGRIIHRLKNAVQTSGALALVTEGGYDLPALRECLEVTIGVIESDHLEDVNHTVAPRGESALMTVRAAQSAFWRGI